ncbi:MAG: carboxypeptidase-like regulatory domain-containing protein, partial [bacterium]
MVGRLVCVTAALLLTAGALNPAAGQSGKLAGIVTDAATGQPLAGVQITVEGTGRTTLTQENGRYFIINIPAGTYTVTAQLLGYATVRRENVQISIDVTRTLDFQLTTEALALEQVVVEAERVPLIQLDATG